MMLWSPVEITPISKHQTRALLSQLTQVSPKSLQRTTGIRLRKHARKRVPSQVQSSWECHIPHQTRKPCRGGKISIGKIGSGLSPHKTKFAGHEVKANPGQSTSRGWCDSGRNGEPPRAVGMKWTRQVRSLPQGT